MKAVLYISYDGMLEPLGQSQVLAYLERMSADRSIHLLSFEKREDWENQSLRDSIANRIQAAGIHWHPRRYHKRPSSLATAWDITVGIVCSLWLKWRYNIGVVHARSYVAAVIALVLAKLTSMLFIFDMRGFWADERVDGGLWPKEGRMHRMAKWFERRFLLRADHVVSLTSAAVAEMKKFEYLQARCPPMTVIPTCADLDRFTPGKLPADGFVLGYVGSAGTWYQFDAAVAAFRALRERIPDARFLVINRNEHDYIKERLREGGVNPDCMELRSASHAEVPLLMARMHAGVFFIKPLFSKQASAPTKLGEFLGCGIPCLSNTGVGDMAAILESNGVGAAVESFDVVAINTGVDRLIALKNTPGIRDRCVQTAYRHFSLDEGVTRYQAIYRTLESD